MELKGEKVPEIEALPSLGFGGNLYYVSTLYGVSINQSEKAVDIGCQSTLLMTSFSPLYNLFSTWECVWMQALSAH